MYLLLKMVLLILLMAISGKVTAMNGEGYLILNTGMINGQSFDSNLNIYNLSSDKWTQLPTMTPNNYGPMITHQDKIFAIAQQTFLLLRNVSETYHILATPLINHDATYGNAVGVEVGGRIYVLGGGNEGSNEGKGFERYDPCSGHWEILASPQYSHAEGNLAEINGNIYVCGGFYSTKSNMCEYYSISANVWEPFNYPMLSSYYGTSLVAVNNTLFQFTSEKNVAKFDFDEGKWQALTPVPNAENPRNVVRIGEAIYVQTNSNIYRYDGNSSYNLLTENPPGYVDSYQYSNNFVYVKTLPNYSCAR